MKACNPPQRKIRHYTTVISHINSIVLKIDVLRLENTKGCTYFDSKITSIGRSKREVISRITKDNLTSNKKTEIIISKKHQFRKQLVSGERLLEKFCWRMSGESKLVWSMLLYWSPTLQFRAEKQRRFEEFEVWSYRRILKIPWIEEEVLQRFVFVSCLLKIMNKRKATWMGHILRHDGLLQ